MVNVLVVGANGYVGEALSLALRRQGHTVYGLVRNIEKANELIKGEINVVVGDVAKPETLVEAIKKVDVIVNSTIDFFNPETDLLASGSISTAIDLAGGNKKKFVFISGFLVCAPSDTPLTENSPIITDEAISKIISPDLPVFPTMLRNRVEAERRVLTSNKFYGVVARPPMIYGKSKGRWSIHFQNAEEGKIILYGGGDPAIAYLHLDDFVDGLLRIVNAEPSIVDHQVFMFSEGTRLTQKDIAYALAKGTGKENLKVETAPLPLTYYARGNFHVDPTKAKQVLGWIPTHNLERDAKELYASYKAYGAIVQW